MGSNSRPANHVRHTFNGLENVAWCGRTLTHFDWAFLHADHAIYSATRGSIQPCGHCVTAIRNAIAGKRNADVDAQAKKLDAPAVETSRE